MAALAGQGATNPAGLRCSAAQYPGGLLGRHRVDRGAGPECRTRSRAAPGAPAPGASGRRPRRLAVGRRVQHRVEGRPPPVARPSARARSRNHGRHAASSESGASSNAGRGGAATATSRRATARRRAPARRGHRWPSTTRSASGPLLVDQVAEHAPPVGFVGSALRPAHFLGSRPGRHARHGHHLRVRMRQPGAGLTAVVLEGDRRPHPRVAPEVGDPVAPGQRAPGRGLHRHGEPRRVVARRLDHHLVGAEPVGARTVRRGGGRAVPSTRSTGTRLGTTRSRHPGPFPDRRPAPRQISWPATCSCALAQRAEAASIGDAPGRDRNRADAAARRRR